MLHRHLRVSVVIAALVLAGVAVGAGMGSVAAQDANDTDTDTSVNTTQPQPRGLALGQEISIVMGLQRQQIEREVERESFRLAFSNASANKSQVADRELERIHDTVAENQRERERLIGELQNGSITPTEFSRKMAEINMRVSEAGRSLKEVSDASNRSNVSLNRSRLSRTQSMTRGVLGNATRSLNRTPAGVGALKTARRAHQLARNASNMTGSQVAEMARNLSRERVRTPGERPPTSGQEPAENRSRDGSPSGGGGGGR